MIEAGALEVAVLGAGRMGAQIGCEYALGGHHVMFVARDRSRASAAIDAAFALAAATSRFDAGSAEAARSSIAVVTSTDTIADEVRLIVESVPEDFELKVALLHHAASRWPRAIVASNTSSISIERLATAIGARERTVGTHYWSPPLLMPLVELVRTEETHDKVVNTVLDVLRGLGKRPLLIHDVPGFVWNRLQFALFREALWLVENGVAEPAVVDEIVRDGLARRLRFTGPFETAELGGLSTFAAVAEALFPVLSKADDAPALNTWQIREPDDLAVVRERRDKGLLGELGTDPTAPAPALGSDAQAPSVPAGGGSDPRELQI